MGMLIRRKRNKADMTISTDLNKLVEIEIEQPKVEQPKKKGRSRKDS